MTYRGDGGDIVAAVLQTNFEWQAEFSRQHNAGKHDASCPIIPGFTLCLFCAVGGMNLHLDDLEAVIRGR